MQNPRSPALLHSRSSSLASVPPRPLHPISPASRSVLDNATATLMQGRDILEAPNPLLALGAPADGESKSHKDEHDHHSEEALSEEKKETKTFQNVRALRGRE